MITRFLLLLLGLAAASHDVRGEPHPHPHATPPPAPTPRIEDTVRTSRHANNCFATDPDDRARPQAKEVIEPQVDSSAPPQAKAFAPFAGSLDIKWDDRFLIVGTHAMPDHPMMKGITAWNRQVPLPQDFTGDNAWRIPLKPEPAEHPVSARTSLFKGAIAVAINGVPIFNPIKQDGRTDTKLAGELDEFGGHAGRADDYHYHLPPTFLNRTVGDAAPIGFAMDGYPLYGFKEPDGSAAAKLDEFNGHDHDERGYHYHSTTVYPYLNGGLRGITEIRNGEVANQPRTQGVRPFTEPLRGATITGFEKPAANRYRLDYELDGRTHRIEYTAKGNGGADFEFTGPDGDVTRESHQPRPRGGGGRERPGPGSGGPKREPGKRQRPGHKQQSSHAADPRNPSVVLVLIDDMGWNDTGFAGNKIIETPNLDRLARGGFIFTQAYASAPNCAPTRASLMSGQYPPRHGIYTVVDPRHAPGSAHHKLLAATSREDLAPETITLAERFKSAGYATAMFGMWNLGRGRDTPVSPTAQGFDVFKDPKSLGFDKDRYFNDDGSYLTDRFTDEAIVFIGQKRDAPCFVYLACHAVHAPFEPKPDLLEKYRARGAPNPAYAATVEALDRNIGRLAAALDENTVLVFTSDNGGDRRATAPLKAGKGSLYEGGIRVPAFVHGPGIAKGGTSTMPILSMDFHPTLLELAGLPRDAALDGVSFAATLRGGPAPERDAVFWHFPCYIGGGGPASAIRRGDQKLIQFFESNTVELYDLKADPGETTNLATRHPDQARLLLTALQSWQRETGAAIVDRPNHAYDPTALPKRGREARDKGTTSPTNPTPVRKP